METDKIRLFNSFLKGISLSFLALVATVGAHFLVFSSGDLYWAVTAVTVGTFLSGFLSNYFPDKSLVESEDTITDEEQKFAAMTMAAIAIILNSSTQSLVLPVLLTAASLIALAASFRE